MNAFADAQFWEDVRRRAAEAAKMGARGFATGLLGAPVDIANMAMGSVGGERPVGGSQWFDEKLANAGVFGKRDSSVAGSASEFLGGMMNPAGGLKFAAAIPLLGKPVAAVVRAADGKLFEGPVHGVALKNALAEGYKTSDFTAKKGGASDLFRLDDGTIVPRKQLEGAKSENLDFGKKYKEENPIPKNVPMKKSPSAADVKRAKRVVSTSGQMVGAPPGIDSPQKLGALVKHYAATAESGLAGRNFYPDSSNDVWARAGHDISRADPFVQNLAILSRANQVGGNAAMSAKGHVQAVVGEPVRTGRFPSRDSPAIQEIYDASKQYLGHKREPFAEQLSVAWAPERIGRGVNDMHEAEIMGYPSGAVGGPTQHAFMDEVRDRAIRLLNRDKTGGFDDWGTGTAQAAAWTGNKIRRGDLAPGDAAKDYSLYLPRAEANATWESFPGVGTGHLPNAPQDDFAKKKWFHELPGHWSTSKSGRDIGYTEAWLMPGADVPAVGRFVHEGVAEVNPATVARPLTAMVDDKISQGSRDALDAVEGSRGYFDVQNGAAWHKIMPSKAPGYSAAYLNLPGMSPEQMKALAPFLEAKGLGVGSAPEGLTAMTFPQWGGPAAGEAFSKAVRGAAKEAGLRKPQMDFGALESGYVDYADAWKEGGGAATRGLLSTVDKSPLVRDRLGSSQDYRNTVLAKNERDLEAQKAGWGAPREDVMRAREIFAKGFEGEVGFEALRKALKAGVVLPAAAMVFLAHEGEGQ